jgi:hypothetical protein
MTATATDDDQAELVELRLSADRQAKMIGDLNTELGRLRHALKIAERAQVDDSVRELHKQVRLAVATEFEKQAAALEKRLFGIATKDAGSVHSVELLNGKVVLLEQRAKALAHRG